jgi:hypothetical protein
MDGVLVQAAATFLPADGSVTSKLVRRPAPTLIVGEMSADAGADDSANAARAAVPTAMNAFDRLLFAQDWCA